MSKRVNYPAIEMHGEKAGARLFYLWIFLVVFGVAGKNRRQSNGSLITGRMAKGRGLGSNGIFICQKGIKVGSNERSELHKVLKEAIGAMRFAHCTLLI